MKLINLETMLYELDMYGKADGQWMPSREEMRAILRLAIESVKKQKKHKCCVVGCSNRIEVSEIYCLSCKEDLMQGAQGE